MRAGGLAAMAIVFMAVAAMAASATAPSATAASALAAPPGRAAAASPAHYYLALGDSVSVGVQPSPTGSSSETNRGYTNDIYAYERKYVKNLHLVEIGCPGDTTRSLETGIGNAKLARTYHCDRSGGSQLAAAVAFLKRHHNPGEVSLITLDIGINDINRCGSLAKPAECLVTGEGTVAANLPEVLSTLQDAAPTGTVMAQMTNYDTYLGKYIHTRNRMGPHAAAFLGAYGEANTTIRRDDAAAGFVTADVAGAFDTFATTTSTWHGVRVPTSLATVCRLTWACYPLPVGHNIHPNPAGYRVIAGAFEQAVGRLGDADP